MSALMRRRGVMLDGAALTALLLLLAAGAGLRWAKANGRLQILKLAVPLKLKLDHFDATALSPYVVREKTRLPEDSEHELGTKDYVQWFIENPRVAASHAMRNVSFFLTYYTGNADQVPHVPDECYVVGAFSPARQDTAEFTLGTDSLIPEAYRGRGYKVSRRVFLPPAGEPGATIVYYTFVVNGDFYPERLSVRGRMMRESERYLYYSKVEIAFRSLTDRDVSPEMDAEAARLLGRTIGVMLRDHLPDVKALEAAN